MDPILISLFCGILLLLLAQRMQHSAGAPRGRSIYIDPHRPRFQPPTLIDHAWGLVGKPDAILKRRGHLTPLEMKSSAAPERPHAAHVLQLAAYCRLVEVTYHQRPKAGALVYRDGAFEIRYTRTLELEMRRTAQAIRRQPIDPPRSHHSAARCRGCGYRAACDQALT